MNIDESNRTRIYEPSRALETLIPDPLMTNPGAVALSLPGYEVLERLGGGVMGVVYKARHRQLNRIVAIKVIRSGDEASANELLRFLTEAEASARVNHPNVVQVFEAGNANGRPFLCMEYVDGKSLADGLDGTPWTGPRAAKLVETLASAMAEAHRLGIVHRDVEPANVLIATDGTPKIADFGLAKMVASGGRVRESQRWRGRTG